MSGQDVVWLRPTIQSVLDRTLRSAYIRKGAAGASLTELADIGRELLAGQQLPRRRLGQLLTERFLESDGTVLAAAVELQVSLAHVPPSCTWGGWGTRATIPVALMHEWTGQPLGASPQPETLIRRYLATFGPASVADVQAWSGLTRLDGVLTGLRPQLRVFRDEHGKELFDLLDAPLVSGDLPVPVRFLPAFDNVVLGHADRSRIIHEADRKWIFPGQAMVRPTSLLDGFVAGIWSVKGGVFTVTPFRPFSETDRAAVLTEAQCLCAFLALDPTKSVEGPILEAPLS